MRVDTRDVVETAVAQTADRVVGPAVAVAHRVAALETMVVAEVDGIVGAVDAGARGKVAAAERGFTVADDGAGITVNHVDSAGHPEADTLAQRDAAGDVDIEHRRGRGDVDLAAGDHHRAVVDLRQRLAADVHPAERAVDGEGVCLAAGDGH